MTRLAFPALLLLFFSQCEERNESIRNVPNDKIFTKDVGGRVSDEVAARWVDRKRHSSGREGNFSVTADNVVALLEKTEDKIGVVIHHAVDDTGQHHLFIAPVKADLKSWSNSEVLDAASNEFTDSELAYAWVTDYKNQYPDGPWSHYYGIDMFNDIISTEGFNKIDLKFGQDDNGHLPILLYVSTHETINGKSQSQSTVYDNGAICPSACPNEN
jgi:hypothetical protein